MKGNKIIIPQSLRQETLQLVHSGHMGIEKCLRRARDIIFWPGISNDIKEMVLGCSICLKHRSSNPKEPLIPTEIPDYPWQITGTDLFTWDNKNYLLVVDYYSRYFEVKELSNMKSSTVINKMKGIMARWGISEKVISDNGPCYKSQEFAEFARQWDFDHQVISAYHSQSNGLSEKFVSICKNILTKAKESKTDPLIGILEYRTTPLESGYSPAQLSMGRQLRSVLPTTQDNLKPKVISPNLVKESIKCSKQKQKDYYDRQSKTLEPLKLGQSARIQQLDKTWKPATVVDQRNERSYTVQCPDGTLYTRNRRDLLKTNEPIQNTCVLDPEIPSLPDNTETSNFEIKQSQAANTTQEQDSKFYVTRSGRTVKPKVIESM